LTACGDIACDKGVTLAEVIADYLGTSRPQGSAYDIGVYEFPAAPAPAPTYTITVTQGTNGIIAPDTQISITSGTDEPFTITPSSGYKLTSVVVDGVSVGAVTSYNFSNITQNHTITASFSVISSVSSGGGGGGGGCSIGFSWSPTASSCVHTATTTLATGLTSIQINAILTLLASFGVNSTIIANVRAMLMGTGRPAIPSTIPTSSTHVVFTRTLSLGSTGGDVFALQKYLNTHGFVIAKSGLGSPGNEVYRYGVLTVSAVRRFQKYYGIPQTGIVDPLTRAKLNSF
jgi:hypothetical protein